MASAEDPIPIMREGRKMGDLKSAALSRRNVLCGFVAGGIWAWAGSPAHATPASGAHEHRSRSATAAQTFVVPAATLIPLQGAWFGAFVKHDPAHMPGVSEPELLEAVTGRRLGIDHSFHHWGTPFPQARVDDDIAQGRIPMISWGGGPWVNLQKTAAGGNDEAVRVQARTLRSFGQPILMRFTWEMDLPERGYLDAGIFRDAWRRVREIFREEGAVNVAFVFCPTWYAYQTGEASSLWPGDADVDWIGVDYYARPSNGNARLADYLDPFYAFGSRHGHPMIICETGVHDPGDATQSIWLDQVRVDLSERYPLIGGLVYFDSLGSGETDWVIAGNPATEPSARALAGDSYFRPFSDGIHDLAIGGIATASSTFSGNNAMRTIDGNRLTRWISSDEAAPQLRIDMRRPADPIEIKVRSGVVTSASLRVRAFEVEALVDGGWTRIGGVSGNSAEIATAPVQALRGIRSIRITFTEPNSTDNMARIFAVQVLGRPTS